MDVMTPNQRYKAMAHNRDRTRPELALASSLWKEGFRYLTSQGYKSRYGKSLLGHPDIVFPKKRIAIFVDGCFWHGCHECRKHIGLSSKPWVDKIEATKQRDLRTNTELIALGWKVLRIAEHDVRTKGALEQTIHWLIPLIEAEPLGV